MNGDGEIRWLDGRAFIGVIYLINIQIYVDD